MVINGVSHHSYSHYGSSSVQPPVGGMPQSSRIQGSHYLASRLRDHSISSP